MQSIESINYDDDKAYEYAIKVQTSWKEAFGEDCKETLGLLIIIYDQFS